MGGRNYFKHGSYNAVCEVCGRLRKDDEMLERWDGKMVCSEDYEPRQPQDFARAIEEKQNVPWSRPEQVDTFIATNGVDKTKL